MNNRLSIKLVLLIVVLFALQFFVFYCGGSVDSLINDVGIQDTSVKYCKNSVQCNSDEECKNNVCVKKETTVCRNRTDCKSNQDCINGKCVDIVEDGGIDAITDTGDTEITNKGKISADPMTVEFGAMRFGEKKESVVKVKNIGNADLKILKIELDEKTDTSTFGFKTDFQSNSILKPNDEFTITVSCQQNDEKPDSGDLLIVSDDQDLSILRVKMKNSYKDEPNLMVKYINSKGEEITYPDENSTTNEVTVDMGNIPLSEKKTQAINIINSSEEGILKISEITFDIYNNNDTNTNKFTAILKESVDGNEVILPKYLSGSDSVVLIVDYVADKEAMEDKYSVSIKTGDPDVNNDKDPKEDGLLIINLKAMAGYKDPELAVLDLNDKDILANGINFGEVEKGTEKKSLFKICNIGGGVLKIDKSSALINGNFTLNPSSLEASLTYSQCINNIEVIFNPSNIGNIKDVLKINSNDPSKPVADLNIEGTGINSEMRVNPMSVDFGDILLNASATPVNVEIKNIGDGTLQIFDIKLGAGSSNDFSLSNLPLVYPVKLKQDETINFNVGFKPTSLGEKSGAIIITSSDAENLTLNISLKGNGSNCDSDHADCNNDPSDGCEVDLTNDVSNCGVCNNICSGDNANMICENKKCKIESCTGTYQDCDNVVSNGCESNKIEDKLNCSGCGNICGSNSNCVNGSCLCDTGYLNCDNDFATNGCEVDKNNDPTHCGSCTNNCGENSICNQGVCGCQQDYKNCDQNIGCEVNIKTNPNHCGDCNINCGSNAYCNDGLCKCNDGYGNCDGNPGCEKYLMFDKNNCGECFKVCQNPPNSSGLCDMGQCKFTCFSGYKDCNGLFDDGCEANLSTDPNNCGVCGFKCGDNMECVMGGCVCKLGFADCNGNFADGCEVNLSNNNNHCGTCNNSCGNNAFCQNSSCTCNTGYANCNTLWSDGCEINISNDVYNCGSCSNNCTTLPNVASASCSNYSCVINDCNDDTANCDGNVSNGCEVNHNSYANSCGTAENMGELCGDDGSPSLPTFSGQTSKWLKFKVKECDSGVFADKLAAVISLDVPSAPQDYDLVVYFVCGGSSGTLPQGPGIDEAIEVSKDDEQCWPSDCDDAFDVYVEVKYIGGGKNQCSNWNLTVTSNDGWY